MNRESTHQNFALVVVLNHQERTGVDENCQDVSQTLQISKLGHGEKPHNPWLWNLLSKRAPHHSSNPTFHFFLLSFFSSYCFLIYESTNRLIRQIVKDSCLLPDSHSLAHPASRPWKLVAVPFWPSIAESFQHNPEASYPRHPLSAKW